MIRWMNTACLFILCALFSLTASAATLVYEDPAGDDFGPGTYTYPTDSVYKRGSFDIRKVEVKTRGDKVEFRVTVGTRIEDPWNSKEWDGNGFSLQMAQIYIDTDHVDGSGHTNTLPGINAQFATGDAWDRVVLVSPQGKTRLKSEVKSKGGDMRSHVVIPSKTRVKGKTLVATVSKKALGGAPSGARALQVVMQSNQPNPTHDQPSTPRINQEHPENTRANTQIGAHTI